MTLRKILTVIIMTVVAALLLSGCWSAHDLNKLTIAIGMGIDRTPAGYLVTQQIVNPKAVAVQQGSQEIAVYQYSAEGKNLEDTVRSLAQVNSRQIHSQHLLVLVLSEETARKGINEIIDYMMRNHEYRTDYYIAVAKGSAAKDCLSILLPINNLPAAALYDRIDLVNENWAGSVKEPNIIKTINSILANGRDAVLPGVAVTEGIQDSNTLDGLRVTDGLKKLKVEGVAVFREDKMVGWLTDAQAEGYNYITGELHNTVGYTRCGPAEITYDVMQCKSGIEATVDKEGPSVKVTVEVKYDIGSVDGDLDVSQKDIIQKTDQAVAKDIKGICEEAVYVAQKELRADIFGFGEAVRREDPKYWKTVKDDWRAKFISMPVTVSVTARLYDIGDINKPFNIKEDE